MTVGLAVEPTARAEVYDWNAGLAQQMHSLGGDDNVAAQDQLRDVLKGHAGRLDSGSAHGEVAPLLSDTSALFLHVEGLRGIARRRSRACPWYIRSRAREGAILRP